MDDQARLEADWQMAGYCQYTGPPLHLAMPRAKAATVDPFGRILIPKRLREATGLREGAEVEIIPEDRGVRLLPREEGLLLKTVKGVLVATGQAAGDLASAVQRDRQKRLGKLAGRRR